MGKKHTGIKMFEFLLYKAGILKEQTFEEAHHVDMTPWYLNQNVLLKISCCVFSVIMLWASAKIARKGQAKRQWDDEIISSLTSQRLEEFITRVDEVNRKVLPNK